MIEHNDLSQPVYKKLKQMILDGELKPGEKLLQERLAQELGVSRTPLLKALQMLEYDYLVESIPRRGMFVKQISDKMMEDIYDVREGIESVAVALVVDRITPPQINTLKKIWKPFVGKTKINAKSYQKADEKFHELLFEYSQNDILKSIYSKSLVQLRVAQIGLQRPPHETLQEHLDLLDAVETRDKQKAEDLIKEHIRRSKASMIEKNSQ